MTAERPHGTQTAHGAHAGARPAPNDPERDINAKATVTWVLAWAVILFVGLWLLLVLFDMVMSQERSRKVENLPPSELIDTRNKEREFLAGKGEDGVQRKSIEQIMKEMTSK